jgi:protein-L-isoaspartate O-methyltransferase
VNRADFIPDVIWIRREDGWMYPLDRSEDPERWLALVDSTDAIVTQVDNGELDNGRGIVPTSSSSAPRVMTKMLDLLDVREGMRILEIGAGTGYNAALMAQKATSGHVTTIEVDAGIAEHARTTLGKTGLPVTVITGDGTLGYPENAPYDRVVATAGARRVPYTWVEQANRSGGRIVLPLAVGFACEEFLCLNVNDDGTAQGRFHGSASFMRLRNQRDNKVLWRVSHPDDVEYYGEDLGGIQAATTRTYHNEPFTDFETGFAMGIRLPGWVAGRRPLDGVILLSHFASESWATLILGDGEHWVYHEGPRRLWDEFEAAYQWWVDAGRPEPTRFGVTVTPEGQIFWLDSPDQVVSREE